MPIYEYQCQSCGFLFDELQSMKEEPLVKCPNCGKNELKKLIGSGSGVIFKGTGFYQTDYKKSNASVTQKNTESDSGGIISDTKKETKSSSKKESKTGKKNK